MELEPTLFTAPFAMEMPTHSVGYKLELADAFMNTNQGARSIERLGVFIRDIEKRYLLGSRR